MILELHLGYSHNGDGLKSSIKYYLTVNDTMVLKYSYMHYLHLYNPSSLFPNIRCTNMPKQGAIIYV